MENQREFFVKWMKYLFIIQAVMGVTGILSAVPVLDTLVLWVNRILSIAAVVVLFKMAPLNGRYKKAAIFSCVGLVLVILIDVAALVLVAAICSLISIYQEYCGHAEMIESKDAGLSKKWHSLFNWQIFSGIIVGLLGGVIVAVSVLVFPVSQEILTSVTLALTNGVDLILWIIYLILLKRTYTMYEECEKIEMNDSCE